MATTKSLNQYKASFPDLTQMSVAALSMKDALESLKTKNAEEPSQLIKTASGVLVAVPDPSISIVTKVESEEAAAAGCKATPYSIAKVENGSKVYFTAIPAEGFQFTGWYLNGEMVSNEESYGALIQYDGDVPIVMTYTAQFATI